MLLSVCIETELTLLFLLL